MPLKILSISICFTCWIDFHWTRTGLNCRNRRIPSYPAIAPTLPLWIAFRMTRHQCSLWANQVEQTKWYKAGKKGHYVIYETLSEILTKSFKIETMKPHNLLIIRTKRPWKVLFFHFFGIAKIAARKQIFHSNVTRNKELNL